MTGLLRKAMLFACAGVLAASSAMAAVPSPADSDVPCGINLVGTHSGIADSHGTFSIVVRDLAHNPIAGSAVVIDFNSCTASGGVQDIRICSTQAVTGVTANCAGVVGSINAVTDGSGTITIAVIGGAKNTAPHTPGTGFKCATVYADGVNLGNVNVGAFDENGVGGVNPADVSVMINDSLDFAGSAVYRGRSDFNCTNSVNPADISLELGVSLGFLSLTSCGTYCH